MGTSLKKVEETLKKYAQEKGKTVEEVRASFEAVLDKFENDGAQGKRALKFLGFDERPTVDEFVAALANNPALQSLIKQSK